MKILLLLCALLTASLTMPGCAHAPPTLPTDTLVYFTIDIDEMPGDFAKAVLHTADKSWSVGTAWDMNIRKKPKTVVCYVAVPYDKPVYLSELHSDNSGILTGRRYDMYVMSPQETPLRIERSAVKAGIRYGGAFKFKLIEHGLFKGNNFTLQRCTDCPTEKETLAYLVKIGETGNGELNENGYLGKLSAKLRGMK